MAYAPGGSTRINTWSKPELSDGTQPWGVEAGVEADSRLPGTDGADNARLLNLTGGYIASLRGSAEAEIGVLGDIWSPDNAGLIAPNQLFQLSLLPPEPPNEQIRWTFGTEPRGSDLGSTAWADRVDNSGFAVGSGLPNNMAVWVTVWGRNPTISYVIAQKRFNRDRIWASCDSFATRVAPEAFMNAACDPNATFGSQCWTSGDVAICDLKDAPPPQTGLPIVDVATRYHEACSHDADHSEVLSVWGTTYTGQTFCCALADDLDEITSFELYGSPRKDEVMLGDDALSVDVRPLHSTHSFTVDVFGRNGPDEILGSTYDGTTFPYYTETLDGEAQDDYLEGRGGTVTLFGGLDNDELIGGDAVDFLHGDAGADILEGGGASDFLYGGSENDTISGDGGNDLCWGEDGADTIHGNDGNDTLRGGNGVDYLYGDNGTDTLLGEADMDVLYGGNDADKLDGGAALDALYGDAGNDKLCETSGNTGTFSGGAGADIVKFIPPSGTPGVIGSDSDNNLTCTQSYVTGGGTGCSSVLSNGNSFWSTVSCSP